MWEKNLPRGDVGTIDKLWLGDSDVPKTLKKHIKKKCRDAKFLSVALNLTTRVYIPSYLVSKRFIIFLYFIFNILSNIHVYVSIFHAYSKQVSIFQNFTIFIHKFLSSRNLYISMIENEIPNNSKIPFWNDTRSINFPKNFKQRQNKTKESL